MKTGILFLLIVSGALLIATSPVTLFTSAPPTWQPALDANGNFVSTNKD